MIGNQSELVRTLKDKAKLFWRDFGMAPRVYMGSDAFIQFAEASTGLSIVCIHDGAEFAWSGIRITYKEKMPANTVRILGRETPSDPFAFGFTYNVPS